ncbi:VOC family protein [Chitinophaga sp. 30R24]|uniref:VOC family protein n=1 Tax=Chitinophaga sp. 30R24 TaxID=3248838 RepID=UPI003B8FE72B
MPVNTIIPVLVYEDIDQAITWLSTTFGFRLRWRAGNHRAQLALGEGAIVVSAGMGEAPTSPRQDSVMIRIADADTHYAQVKQQGAQVLEPPTDFPYGERQYRVVDPWGHYWTFSQSIADKLPEEWGGTAGEAL